MTNKAIKFFETEIRSLELAPELNGCEMTEEWQEQMDIFKAAKEALEKQIPKKPRERKAGFKSFDYVCPECGGRIISKIDGEWIAGKHSRYCERCGQALDWGDAE